jgi:hypothetical protein
MSKQRKNRSKGKSLEQRAFEALSKQIHQLNGPGQAGYPSKKNCSGSQAKLSRPAVSLTLNNGKILNGTIVSFADLQKPRVKLFFSAGRQRTGGSEKDFCIPSYADTRSQDGNTALINDLNDFLRDVHEQALAEFPEWLEKWGCRSHEYNPLLNLDEIREEWRFKKGQFGAFRLAAQAGFFTGSRPFDAERLEITDIEIYDLPPRPGRKTAEEGSQPPTNY